MQSWESPRTGGQPLEKAGGSLDDWSLHDHQGQFMGKREVVVLGPSG